MSAINETYRLSFRPYSRPLKIPIKMSRGEIDNREGLFVHLEDSEGKIGLGEAVTLPYFGTETAAEACALLESIKTISLQDIQEIPARFLASRFALESAILSLSSQDLFDTQHDTQRDTQRDTQLSERQMPVSKLLPSGADAIKTLGLGLEEGYSTFKWKIGVNSIANEQQTFSELLAQLKPNCRLRLDANAGLNLEETKRWLQRCEGTNVEFIEQPMLPDELTAMSDLLQNYSTPIALDESVARFQDIENIFEQGWQGIYVVKAMRLGELATFLKWRSQTESKIVYSSALETSIGTEVALRIAASDKNNNYALGYGVSHFFHDDGFNLHPRSPHLSVGKISEEQLLSIWAA